MIKEIYYYIKNLFDEKHYIKFALLSIFFILVILSCIVLLVFLANALLRGVGAFLETNAVVLMIIGIVAWWIVDRWRNKTEPLPQQPADIDAATLEFLQAPATFEKIVSCIFNAGQEIASFLPIETPRSSSGIMSKTNFFRKGAFTLYQFQFFKIGDITEELFKHTLQERLRQKLQSKEFVGFTQDVYIHTSGVAYPILLVDSVTILEPTIIVNIAVASKNYCSYLESLPVNSREHYGVPNDKQY